ncbi:MAG: dihydrofolate reductase [Hyphomicrobium sp.]
MSVLISLIVAVAENGVIGVSDAAGGGGLPWRMSSDLKTFRRLTLGKPIIMGRRTWAALPKKPLDGRDNIVVTRDTLFEAPGATVVHTLADALIVGRTLARTSGAGEVMIIGGAEIYAHALPLADRIYLTDVHAVPEGDVRFPAFDPAEWETVSTGPLPRGERDDHAATLRILDRIPRPG